MRVYITKSALKSLDKLKSSNLEMAQKIRHFIEVRLVESENPRTFSNAKKLHSKRNLFRWRLGDYRIVGEFKGDKVVIKEFCEILLIGDRKEVYEKLKQKGY